LKRASGSASAAATIASGSRTKRRRTALTKPALRGARRVAAATAWSTRVCSA
jgi:hypothetical protein